MSRDKILNSLGDLKKPIEELDIQVDREPFVDKLDKFKEMLDLAGGKLLEVDNLNLDTIKSNFKRYKNIVDTTNILLDTPYIKEPDITIIEAKFAIAENGAVWVEWSDEYPRSLITLSEALAIILDRDSIYETMQEAYDSIDFENISYGLFLSGPSKTADIEQSLVFGAHGAVELKIFLVDTLK